MSVEQIARPISGRGLMGCVINLIAVLEVGEISTELGTDWFLVLRAIIDSDW